MLALRRALKKSFYIKNEVFEKTQSQNPTFFFKQSGGFIPISTSFLNRKWGWIFQGFTFLKISRTIFSALALRLRGLTCPDALAGVSHLPLKIMITTINTVL
jgi:hypothetical protein